MIQLKFGFTEEAIQHHLSINYPTIDLEVVLLGIEHIKNPKHFSFAILSLLYTCGCDAAPERAELVC